jgi:hypothetical protein
VPWELVDRISSEETGDSAVIPRVACSRGYSAVCADFAWWNRQDYATKGDISLFVGPRNVSKQPALSSFNFELSRREPLRALNSPFQIKPHSVDAVPAGLATDAVPRSIPEFDWATQFAKLCGVVSVQKLWYLFRGSELLPTPMARCRLRFDRSAQLSLLRIITLFP